MIAMQRKENLFMSETFSAVIARNRHKKGLSQRQLATIVGVNNSTIARIERNEIAVVSPEISRSLAEALDVDFNYLLAVQGVIDDEPEIRIIQRAARHMSQEQKERMVQLLRLTFPDAFRSLCDDAGNPV